MTEGPAATVQRGALCAAIMSAPHEQEAILSQALAARKGTIESGRPKGQDPRPLWAPIGPLIHTSPKSAMVESAEAMLVQERSVVTVWLIQSSNGVSPTGSPLEESKLMGTVSIVRLVLL